MDKVIAFIVEHQRVILPVSYVVVFILGAIVGGR
jgi:hypothetical protein